jgi:hypothetical protein
MPKTMKPRQSANPKRRIAPPQSLDASQQASLLAAARYVGSALHKRTPSDYGFHPPSNPRPHKSLCDDLRPILRAEAEALFAAGIRKDMISTHREGDLPKYVWSVDNQGEVYEAKIGNDGYHGYRLQRESEDAMRSLLLREWSLR